MWEEKKNTKKFENSNKFVSLELSQNTVNRDGQRLGMFREIKNDRFIKTNEFIEQLILLNERFYWTIIQSENERTKSNLF